MTLQWGRPMVAIPGPSIMPDQVLAAMQRPMVNIYAGELVDVTHSVLNDLKLVARTEGNPFIAIANGHGAWEMAITNTLSRGDKVLVLESGHFATGWGAMAAMLGVEMEVLPGTLSDPVDPAAVQSRLQADTGHEFKAVLVVQVDTGTSVVNDIPAIRAAIDAAGHPALFMVDAIASLGAVRFEMDAWGVDVLVGATQKALMAPPGVGLVWANAKAWDAYHRSDLHSAYWDWGPRADLSLAHYFRFAGTPPVPHLFAMRAALDLLFQEGLEAAWHRHDVLARAVHAALDAWSVSTDLRINVAQPSARAQTVTTVRTTTTDAESLRSLCETRTGLTLGQAVGGLVGQGFRIGHMGHLNPPMLLGTLGTLEAGLIAQGASLERSGVGAAAAVIGEELGAAG
ncbi:MAG: aminotransferase class V-fold PLP-dependent enzyme [Actinomycetota bacterium]|nr:aminotransferase class V-fold PLP-dependent enzyme [Actinomycetota bacterium]